jgi:hypothetical protein
MSDHVSGPRAIADPVADITDVYAFPCPEGPQNLVLIMNVFPFGGSPPFRFDSHAGPRFNGACPLSPAAVPKITERNAGTSAIRTGIPHHEDPWGWICGFYPGSEPGEYADGTATTFDRARADFEAAWRVFLSKRTEADFQAWRDQRDWTERKYALWDAGKKLEPPSYGPSKPCSRFRKCPCGEVFDMHGPDEVLVHVPHITAEAMPAP